MTKLVFLLLFVFGLAASVALTIKPDGPPFEPADALNTFQLAEGLQIEVFAGEPLVTDPVDIEIDEYGRMYVVEMPGYPIDIRGSGKVKLLLDTDGDGWPDESVVFADNLTLPTGVMRWKNGILVTDAPNVYYLEDVDGDGRADRRDTVLTGFALSNPQHNFNNPLYGVDNGIYLANNGPIRTRAFADEFGDGGSEVRFAGSYSVLSKEPQGSHFAEGDVRLGRNAWNRNVRFRPDTRELEAMSSSSQWGHAFDWAGNHFLIGNAAHQYHEVIAQRYLERNPALPVRDVIASMPEHGDAADVFPITLDPDHQLLTDRGVFTSASGLTLYSGAELPSEYDGVAFVAEPVHNLVHADVIRPHGATFRSTRLFEHREFLASTDSWFRPVNFYVGPDGALYVIDYYREIIEHPEWMDEEAVRTRDLYRGTDRGRIYRIARTGAEAPKWLGSLDLADASDLDLVRLLDHESAWWRLTAQRLLVDRGGAVGSQALSLLRSAGRSSAFRVHALWTLDGLGRVEHPHLAAALADSSAGVRRNALRLVEKHGASKFEAEMLAMKRDPDPQVRFQLLLTLGDLASRSAEEARLDLLLADIHDSWFHIAALTAGVPPTAAQLDRALALLETDNGDGARAYVQRVAMLVAAAGDESAVEQTLDLVIRNPARPAAAALLRGLAEGLRVRSAEGGTSAARQHALLTVFFDHKPTDVERQSAILDVLRASGGEAMDDEFKTRALELAADSTAEPASRRLAIGLLEMTDVTPFEADLKVIIRSGGPPEVEAASIRALGTSSAGDPAFLIDQFPRLSTAGREAALDVLTRSEEGVRELLGAVESGSIAPGAVGWNRRVALMRDWDGDVRERARRLLRVSDAARTDVVRRYLESLEVEGDADRGRSIFLAACSRCHIFREDGLAYGPDLGTVAHWSPHALLEAIIDPARTVTDGYELWEIRRRDGSLYQGVVRSETASAVTVGMEGGVEIVVPRSEIEAMVLLEGSPMPEGLEEEIGIEEMADLVAFLTGTG